MSVKRKVKKLNKKIENLHEELQTYQLSNSFDFKIITFSFYVLF